MAYSWQFPHNSMESGFVTAARARRPMFARTNALSMPLQTMNRGGITLGEKFSLPITPEQSGLLDIGRTAQGTVRFTPTEVEASGPLHGSRSCAGDAAQHSVSLDLASQVIFGTREAAQAEKNASRGSIPLPPR